MRRPIIAVLLGFAGGITIEYFLSIRLLFLLVSFVCIIPLVGVHFYRKKIPFEIQMADRCYALSLFAVFFVLGAISFLYTDEKNRPLQDFVGETVTVEGTVLSVQQKEPTYSKLTLRTEHEKALVNISGLLLNPMDLVGRKIQVRGIVELPSERRNPATFDYRLYLKTRGVYSIVKAKSYDLVVAKDSVNIVTNSLAKLKYGFMNKLSQSVDLETMGILVGMLFGDKTLIEEDTYESFQKNGIAHILSVSGIHVGIVYGCMNQIFGKRRRGLFSFITIVFLLFYAALAEFSPSVVRAVSMIVVHILSKLMFQKYDLTTCTCACAFSMLLYNPFYLFNVGFQLSYLAVLTLAVVLPWTSRQVDFLRERNCSEFLTKPLLFIAPVFVIQVGMAPYTAYCFNYFSLGALLLNIPIIFLAGLVIPIGVGMLGIFFLHSLLGQVGIIQTFLDFAFDSLGFVEVLLIGTMDYANQLFYQSGKSFFSVVSPSAFFIFSYYLLMFFVFSEFFRVLYQRNLWMKIAKFMVVGVMLSFLLTTFLIKEYDKANLVFIDVGQGDSLHIRTPKGKNILIDGGGSLEYDVGKKILLPYLLKNGVKKVDLAIVTHLHEDHYGGIQSLARSGMIEKIGIYESNQYKEALLLKETLLEKEALLYLTAGQKIQLEDDIYLEILYPEKKNALDYKNSIENEEDENKSSLIVRVNYQGLSVLMTGDIGFDGEMDFLDFYDTKNGKAKSDVRTDILKIGHHGSKYSTSDQFLESIDPKIAVFQVGKNNFGHPNEGVIEKCKNSGIMVYRNDTSGAIILSKGKQWHIETMIKGSTLIKK